MAPDVVHGVTVEQTEAAIESPPFFRVLPVFFFQMLMELGSFIVDFFAPFAPEDVDNILSGLCCSISYDWNSHPRL